MISSKVIQAQCFIHKIQLLAPRIDCSDESEPKESYQVGLKVKHSRFHRVTTMFLPAIPSWQIHTQRVSLQGSRIEIIHLEPTELFHEGSNVNWLFSLW